MSQNRSWRAAASAAAAAAGACGWIPVSGKCRKGEPDTLAQFSAEFSADAFDRPERLPRVRAFVVAVLDNQTTRGRAADMINRLVDRLQGRSLLLPYRLARHGVLLGWAGWQRIWLGRPLKSRPPGG